MNIKKYIIWISAVAVVSSIWWLSVEALSINNANFDKGLPIFKTIFFRSEGKDSINWTTNAEWVRIDNGWIYTAPVALPWAGGNVLKLNWASSQVFIDPVQSANIANDSISNIKIMDNSIINSNFADLAITNEQIQNNTITKLKFDPAIVWPTGWTMYITNNVCNPNNAIVSTNNGTATCALLPTWATTSLPTCSAWQQPVYTGGVWACQTLLLWAWGWDLYRTWSTGSWIANSNPGNVWIGIDNPGHTLTVSGTTNIFEVQWESEEQVYCYASDTWVPVSVYNPAVCAWCSAWLSYNSISGLCEANSCIWSGAVDWVCWFANGQSYSVAPWKFLCSAGTATPVAGSGPWTWDCLGNNGWLNASCSAYPPTSWTAYAVWWQWWGIFWICTLVPWFTQWERSQDEADYSVYANKNIVATFDVWMDNAPANCHRTATADFAPGDLTAPLTFTDGLWAGDFTCGWNNYCSAYGGQGIISLTEY